MSKKYSGRIHDPNHTRDEYDIYFNEFLIDEGSCDKITSINKTSSGTVHAMTLSGADVSGLNLNDVYKIIIILDQSGDYNPPTDRYKIFTILWEKSGYNKAIIAGDGKITYASPDVVIGDTSIRISFASNIDFINTTYKITLIGG